VNMFRSKLTLTSSLTA